MRVLTTFVTAILLATVVFQSESAARTRFGEEVVVRENMTVNDAVSFGKDVRVFGTVTGDAVSIGGRVIIERGGSVKGDAVSVGRNVRVRSGGTVRGDAVSIGGRIDVDHGGEVKGSLVDTKALPGINTLMHVFPHALGGIGPGLGKIFFLGPLGGIFGAFGFMFSFFAFLLKLAVSFAIAAFITYIFPINVSTMADYLHDGFPKALLLGCLIVVMVPFIVLFLMITIIGIPIVPLFLLFLFLSYLFGTVGIALWVGRIIPESEGRSLIINVLLGVVVVGIVKNIPIIGFIVGLAFAASAFGVVVLTRFTTRPHGAV